MDSLLPLSLCFKKVVQRGDRLICSFVFLYHREGLVETLCRPATIWWPQQRRAGIHEGTGCLLCHYGECDWRGWVTALPVFWFPHTVVLLPIFEFICDVLPLVVFRGVWGGLSWVPATPRKRTYCGCHQDSEVNIFRLTVVELSTWGNNYGAVQSPEHCAPGGSCHQK